MQWIKWHFQSKTFKSHSASNSTYCDDDSDDNKEDESAISQILRKYDISYDKDVMKSIIRKDMRTELVPVYDDLNIDNNNTNSDEIYKNKKIIKKRDNINDNSIRSHRSRGALFHQRVALSNGSSLLRLFVR